MPKNSRKTPNRSTQQESKKIDIDQEIVTKDWSGGERAEHNKKGKIAEFKFDIELGAFHNRARQLFWDIVSM